MLSLFVNVLLIFKYQTKVNVSDYLTHFNPCKSSLTVQKTISFIFWLRVELLNNC